jgi:Uma2 family endonuclease
MLASMVSPTTSEPIPPGEYVPTADQRILLRGLSWAGFQALIALRGERSTPRMAYLDGVVELMGPSRKHEAIKSSIGCLVEAFFSERGIPWSPYGHWHLDDESEEAGVEPDECFIFGRDQSPDRPALAIEVVWTSGGLNKLEVYRRLGVGEVWFWKRDAISVHVLGPDGYEVRDRSACLPDIDLALIARLARNEVVSDAVDELRGILRGA